MIFIFRYSVWPDIPVVDGVKDFLGIHSPSRVFASIGKFSAEGFDQGFDKYDLDKQITGNIKNTLGHVKTSIQGIGGSGNYTTNDNKQTINIYQPVKTPSEMARAIRLEQQYGLAGV